MSSPLVSVIITSFNHASFIRESIQSVLDQTHENIEVIIVDDGSSDLSTQKIAEFKDLRIKTLFFKKNHQAHPRNTAIKMARGKYIAFQNSDDVWVRSKLENQVKKLESDTRIVGCFTGVSIINRWGWTVKKTWATNLFQTQNRSGSKWSNYFYEKGNCLCISSAIVKKEVFDKVGLFNTSLLQLSDFDLWIRLVRIGKIFIIDEPLVKMRVINNANISSPSQKSYNRFVSEYAQILERYILSKDEKRQITVALTSIKLATPWHRLFADRVLARILSEPDKFEARQKSFSNKLWKMFISNRESISIKVTD